MGTETREQLRCAGRPCSAASRSSPCASPARTPEGSAAAMGTPRRCRDGSPRRSGCLTRFSTAPHRGGVWLETSYALLLAGGRSSPLAGPAEVHDRGGAGWPAYAYGRSAGHTGADDRVAVGEQKAAMGRAREPPAHGGSRCGEACATPRDHLAARLQVGGTHSIAQPASFGRDVREIAAAAHVFGEQLSDVIECGSVPEPRDTAPTPLAVDEAAQRAGKPAGARPLRCGMSQRAATGRWWRLLHARR